MIRKLAIALAMIATSTGIVLAHPAVTDWATPHFAVIGVDCSNDHFRVQASQIHGSDARTYRFYLVAGNNQLLASHTLSTGGGPYEFEDPSALQPGVERTYLITVDQPGGFTPALIAEVTLDDDC